MCLDLVRKRRSSFFVTKEAQNCQRHALELNSAPPCLAQFLKHGPRDGTLNWATHDVRANS